MARLGRGAAWCIARWAQRTTNGHLVFLATGPSQATTGRLPDWLPVGLVTRAGRKPGLEKGSRFDRR